MKNLLNIALALTFSLGMISCSSSQNNFNSKKASAEKIKSTLNNTLWVLKRIDIDKRDFIPTEEQKELVLGFDFDNNFYNTSDGCNGQGGEFKVEDNKINFSAGMSTMRYCGEEMKHLIYRVPLGKVKSMQIKKNLLQLYDENNVLIATYTKKE